MAVGRTPDPFRHMPRSPRERTRCEEKRDKLAPNEVVHRFLSQLLGEKVGPDFEEALRHVRRWQSLGHELLAGGLSERPEDVVFARFPGIESCDSYRARFPQTERKGGPPLLDEFKTELYVLRQSLSQVSQEEIQDRIVYMQHRAQESGFQGLLHTHDLALLAELSEAAHERGVLKHIAPNNAAELFRRPVSVCFPDSRTLSKTRRPSEFAREWKEEFAAVRRILASVPLPRRSLKALGEAFPELSRDSAKTVMLAETIRRDRPKSRKKKPLSPEEITRLVLACRHDVSPRTIKDWKAATSLKGLWGKIIERLTRMTDH